MYYNKMDNNTIKEIVNCWLADMDIVASNAHHQMAIDYYNEHGYIPDITQLLNLIIDNGENNEPYEQNNDVSNTDEENPAPNENENNNDNESESGSESESDNDNENSHPQESESEAEVQQTGDGPLFTSIQQMHSAEQREAFVIQYFRNPNNQIFNVVQTLQGSIDLSEDSEAEVISRNSQMIDVKKIIKNIDSIPLNMFKNLSANDVNTECHICYDQFVPTDIVRILPCKHILHKCCIDDHLTKQSHLCPYCGAPAGEYSFLDL